MYVSLHCHYTNGSIGDSVLTTEDAIKKAKLLNMSALAMTDHGSLSNIYDFYQECKKNDIKPIIGMEAYITEDRLIKTKEKSSEGLGNCHLVLLAINSEGVHDLISIHNDAQLDGFYFKPRTDLSVLKKYGKNIIALSACVGGEIPKIILTDKNDWESRCIKKIEQYKDVFHSFYLELQPGTFTEQVEVNKALVYLARKTNTPIVVTNDVHYLNKEDYLIHNYHVASCNAGLAKENADELIYPDTTYYLMGEDEVKKRFVYNEYVTEDVVQEGIDNTAKIANICTGEMDIELSMPSFKQFLPKGVTSEQELARRCFNELNRKIHTVKNPSEYTDRLLKELDTISKLQFCDYFLIVRDILDIAAENGIRVGPGRGSGAGSLALYLLGITKIDPIEHNLLFERFLSPNRPGLPDVDLDIARSRRNELQKLVVEKYGFKHCAKVYTLQMRKARQAIKDAGRVLNYDPSLVNDEICKLIRSIQKTDEDGETSMHEPTLDEALDYFPELKAVAEKHKQLFDMALVMEGFPKASSIHAAGVVISPADLTNIMPLVMRKKDQDSEEAPWVLVSALTKECIEKFCVKFDFLGLATLDIIDNTIKVAGIDESKIDLSNENFYDDDKVWDLIGSKMSQGVFQISSNTYKRRMPDLHPRNLDELAACLALVRGPCIASGLDKKYMNIINGREQIDPICNEYYNVTKHTYCIPIYQEEVMMLAVEFGFDLDTGYHLLKACSKKKIDKIKEYKDRFIKCATQKGIPLNIANRVWKNIEDSGKYSFNVSHATCYASITYLSAWLKIHYPVEFMASLLTFVFTDKKKSAIKNAIIKEIRDMNIEFKPLDVNKSKWAFTVEDGKIRIGFSAVKGVGEKSYDVLAKGVPYNSLQEFYDYIKDKKGCNKSPQYITIINGGFSFLNKDYNKLCDEYGKIRKDKEPLKENKNIIFENKSLKDIELFYYDTQIMSLGKRRKK